MTYCDFYFKAAQEVIRKNGSLIMPEGMFESLSKERQLELLELKKRVIDEETKKKICNSGSR